MANIDPILAAQNVTNAQGPWMPPGAMPASMVEYAQALQKEQPVFIEIEDDRQQGANVEGDVQMHGEGFSLD